MILITGGLGFIGVHAARTILAAGEDVVLTRHRRGVVPSFLAGEIDRRLWVEAVDAADARQLGVVIARYGVDGIVHLSGPPARGLAPVAEMRSATGGLLGVLEAAGEAGVGRVSVASSVLVYGDPPRPPVLEDQALGIEADHPIQAAKLAEEAQGSYLASRLGVEVVFLRIAVVYGPCYHSLLNAPARLCHRAAGRWDRIRGLPDPLRGHPDQALDLCYVKDCAAAIGLVALADSLEHRVYNVGTGSSTTLSDLVAAINQAAPTAALALDPRADDPPPAVPAMGVGRLRRELGYQPRWSLTAGVEDYLAWLDDHDE